jgi:hypothetical protein
MTLPPKLGLKGWCPKPDITLAALLSPKTSPVKFERMQQNWYLTDQSAV